MENWPSFGYFPFKGTYFKMHRGISNKQYADIPSSSVLALIEHLSNIENEPLKRDDVLKKGTSAIDEWNAGVKETFKLPDNMVTVSLDKYYWGQSKQNEIYGLRIRVNKKIFFDFLKERSQSLKSVYKVFEYIYECKDIFTQKLLEDNNFPNKMELYINKVKTTASEDLSEISMLFQSLKKSSDNIRNEIIKNINKLIKKGSTPSYTPYTLIYLNELRLKCDSLESLSHIGDFPACLSQMRGIIEGLTSNIFLDQLRLNFLPKDKLKIGIDFRHLFNEDSYQEAMNYNIRVKEINRKSHLVKNEVLKGLVDHIYPSSDEIKKFIVNLHKRMSFASYLIVYGLTFSNPLLKDVIKNKPDQSKLWIFNTMKENNDTLINIGLEEIEYALKDSGIYDVKKIKEYIGEIREKMKGEIIVLVPPTPTMPMRISSYSVLTQTTASGFKEMYKEFSPFTHTTWETYTVWPFTSVLEIMTFKNNLRRFVEVLGGALDDYLAYFNKMIDHFLL